MIAVKRNNLEATRMLLKAGADPCYPHNDGVGRLTPLDVVARGGYFEIIRLMWTTIPADKLAQHENDTRAISCLIVAALYGNTSMLEYLLDGGSTVHTVKMLLDRVKIYTPDTLQGLLFHAVDFRASDARDLGFCETRAVDTTNHELLVKLLLEAGPSDPDVCDEWGTPLIHYAVVAICLIGALRAVLAKGADPNARDRKGRTPLQRVSVPMLTDPSGIFKDNGFYGTGIHLLLKHGASVTAADHEGETPLHTAAFACDLYLFKCYLGPNIGQDSLSAANNHGETLLHYAAASSNIGGQLEGWTPLICALAPRLKNYYEEPNHKPIGKAVQAAQLLLSYGADSTAVTAEGWSALHCLSCHESHPGNTGVSALTEALIEKGAPLQAKARSMAPGWFAVSGWNLVRDYEPEYTFPWGFRMQRMAEVAPEGVFEAEAMTALHWARRFDAKAVEGVLLAREEETLST